MMANYKIAGIDLAFDYAMDDYFKDNIEKYRIDDSIQPFYHIKTIISHFFEIPKIPLTVKYQTRFQYESETESILIVYDDEYQFIKQKQTKSKDLSEIVIQLNPAYEAKLAEMEYIATGMAFFDIALHEKHLPLHAAAIAYHNEAILISAPSKTGKSTQAKMWVDSLKDAYILNDDKPLIWKQDNQFFASGTPWSGKAVINYNHDIPLKTIVFLSQGSINKVTPLDNKEKLRRLLQNAYRPNEIKMVDTLVNLLSHLIESIPMQAYSANMDISAFTTLYNSLYKEVEDEN
jgi:hypothetical protein